MRSAAIVMLVLALGACSKKSDKPQGRESGGGGGGDAGAQGGMLGGGSLGNGTATDAPGASSNPKNGVDPGTMSSGNAGHTFAH